MEKTFKYCFVFVCQQGELEIKSLLLAASLKRFLRCDYELVAAVPKANSLWGNPLDLTIQAMQSLGVRIIHINNPIGQHYPIGNKLAAIAVETDADKIVFLDSDMICMREFERQERFAAYGVQVKAADLATYSSDMSLWHKIYGMFQLECPAIKVRSTVTKTLMPPYYNAGFVAVERGNGVPEAWIKISQQLDISDIPNKYPWLDQIALPVALSQLDVVVDVLDERYNYPLHLKPLDAIKLPFFCHYHDPGVIRREPVLNRLVVSLAKSNACLYALMKQSPQWSLLLEDYQLSGTFLSRYRAVNKPEDWSEGVNPSELIITGIPRSGTSYLCKLLHQVDDVVVINEPEEVFTKIPKVGDPWQFATYYREVRKNLLDGGAIENKIKSGEMIEDTAKGDERESYRPKFGRADFVLATKNTLVYASRIPNLRRVLPYASMFACIRNPFDTIASWKSTFDHLKEARVGVFSLAGGSDSELSSRRRDFLSDIELEPSVAIRRALLWSFLAEGLYDDFDTKHIIRYEDLCVNPTEVVKRVMGDNGWVYRPFNLSPSSVSKRRDILSLDDLQAIGSICSPIANLFGYEGI